MENVQENGALEDNEFGGMFNMGDNAITAEDAGSSESFDPDFYRTSLTHKGVKDGIYSGLGRFLPNPKDVNNSTIHKWVYYFESDPENPDKGTYVDCPSNGGNKFNIITQAYFELKEHESAVLRGIAKQNFMRKPYYWSLYHVMKDDQQPDMVGKIKIYRYGKQVYEKYQELNTADPSIGKSKINVFDPFYGKDFVLKIKEKSVEDKNTGKMKKQTTYESSYFMEGLSSISPDNGPTRYTKSVNPDPTIANAENTKSMRAMFEFLKNNAPDLSKVAYKPWDEKMEEKAVLIVRGLIGDDKIFNSIMSKVRKNDGKPAKVYQSEVKETATTVAESNTANVATQTEQKKENVQPVVSNAVAEIKQEQERIQEKLNTATEAAPEKEVVKEAVAEKTEGKGLGFGDDIDFGKLMS